MNKQLFLLPLLFLLCCSFTEQHNKEWKKISNQLYSIAFPPHWTSRNETGDGITPQERDAKSIGYHLYYLIWETPLIDFDKDLPEHILCFIQSYEKIDSNSPIALKDIEDLEMRQISDPIKLCSKEIIKSPKSQRRFVVVQESQEFDKTYTKYRVYYLLQQKGKKVHSLMIRLREKYAQEHPEIAEEIKQILDSFTIK